ncbi:adhesive plaque matrix protein-like [Penaeus chinensis]|uniref:adhesive plaque matrix protein-like n=1 Tax=Penaeus chinensis TaxID=139456 RepID=UPI001FB74B58|nr:adhesive plaque matrix protein-like [Penaeus chinensis]
MLLTHPELLKVMVTLCISPAAPPAGTFHALTPITHRHHAHSPRPFPIVGYIKGWCDRLGTPFTILAPELNMKVAPWTFVLLAAAVSSVAADSTKAKTPGDLPARSPPTYRIPPAHRPPLTHKPQPYRKTPALHNPTQYDYDPPSQATNTAQRNSTLAHKRYPFPTHQLQSSDLLSNTHELEPVFGAQNQLQNSTHTFDYSVKDTYSGNDFGHQESRDGDDTQGSYYRTYKLRPTYKPQRTYKLRPTYKPRLFHKLETSHNIQPTYAPTTKTLPVHPPTKKPKPTYLPTTRPQSSYLPTKKTQSTDLLTAKPQTRYLSAEISHPTYLPTKRPQSTSLPTKRPQSTGLSTKKPQSTYLLTKNPQSTYLPTRRTTYLPTSKPQSISLPASKPPPTYLPTRRSQPTSITDLPATYLLTAKPRSTHQPAKRPKPTYLPTEKPQPPYLSRGEPRRTYEASKKPQTTYEASKKPRSTLRPQTNSKPGRKSPETELQLFDGPIESLSYVPATTYRPVVPYTPN